MATRKAKPVDKGGRPTRYRAEYDEQARKLCMLGYTDKKLAAFFNVTESTLNLWKLRHASFRSSLIAGKETSDMEVVSALRSRAVGYSHPDVHVSNYQGEVTITPIVKHYPPDTPAAMFWLLNRQPDTWKAKRAEQEGEGDAPTPVQVVVEVRDGRRNPED